jgi:glutathione peroxidase
MHGPDAAFRTPVGIYDLQLPALDGAVLDLAQFSGRATLVVNVASRCGLTPQYEGLQRLHERFESRGFSVLGVPCNQFGEQEPGAPEEIAAFCTETYAVSFPLTAKLDVNGPERHPLYRELTSTPDAEGRSGDVQWNFEKFLVSPGGHVVGRFRPVIEPESPDILMAIEAALTATG